VDQPGFELKIRTPRHRGHARPIGQPNERPDAGCDVCAYVQHCGPQECGQFTRDECQHLSAEKVQRVKLFVHKMRNLSQKVRNSSQGWKFFECRHGPQGSKISGAGAKSSSVKDQDTHNTTRLPSSAAQ
jgi:hypothetical protein